MRNIIQKPYLFFFGLAPVAIILGLIFKDSGIDLYYYGGSLSLSYWTLFIFSSVFFALVGLNYSALRWLDKPPKKWLTIIHIFLQLISLVLLVYYILQPKQAITTEQENVVSFLLFVSISLFLIASFIHLINFFISLFLKRK